MISDGNNILPLRTPKDMCPLYRTVVDKKPPLRSKRVSVRSPSHRPENFCPEPLAKIFKKRYSPSQAETGTAESD